MLSLRLRKDKAEQEKRGKQVIERLWKSSAAERELFVACLLVFGASISTIISTQGTIHFALTTSLAYSRTIFLDPGIFSGQAYTVQLGGHTYSSLPPGLSFFTFAVISLGQLLTPLAPSASGVYIAAYTSCIFGALAAVLFFRTARMFGSERASAFATIVFAFGTSIWIYSRIYLPEALAVCFGIGSVYCVLRVQHAAFEARHKGSWQVSPTLAGSPRLKIRNVAMLAFLSGVFLGLGTFVDNMTFFLIVPIFLYLTLGIWFSKIAARSLVIFSFIAGSLGGLIPVWLYDNATTGNAFVAPYGIPFIGGLWPSSFSFNFLGHGLYETLFSPGNGLFLFTPFVLFSLIGFYHLSRQKLKDAGFFLGLFLSILIPISIVSDSTFFLHNTIGPSEVVLAMPYIILPSVIFLDGGRKRLNVASISAYLIGAVSIAITGIIALTDPVLSAAASLSETNSISPLFAINIPLFIGQSFLTWWSFFNEPIVYAILVLVFPILILTHWMFKEKKFKAIAEAKRAQHN